MPSTDRATRQGYNSQHISAHAARIVLALATAQDSHRAAEQTHTTANNVKVWVQHIEKKLHARLFDRKRGRHNTTWTPIYRPLNNPHWRRLRNLAT